MSDPVVEPITAAVIDPIEKLRREILRRLTNVLQLGQIQLENENAPAVLPYVRFTIAQAGDFSFDSQKRMSRIVIAEFDIIGESLSGTREIASIAASIENEFGLFSRIDESRQIALTGTGGSATIELYGRGSAATEKDTGLYYHPVLLYIRLTLGDNEESER